MDQREKVEKLRKMHRYLLEKLERYELENAPKGLDIKKLEEAFDKLNNYKFVLKKTA